MAESVKDKFQGAAHEVDGAVKEKTGHPTNNPHMHDEGTADKFGGRVQKKVGDVEQALGD